MKKIYCALLSFVLISALNTNLFAQTRILKWNLAGNQNWPTVGGANTWDKKANWINLATGLAPATDVASGDKVIIPNVAGVNILVTANMTITFTNFVLEIQGSGEVDIQDGIVLTMSGANTAVNLSAVTNTNGLTLQARRNPGNVQTQLIMNGIVKARNTSNASINTGVTTGNATSTAAANAAVTGFGGFITGSLPVVLTSFNANLTNANNVDISWTTQQEVNSDYFDIQKSSDGVKWLSIGTVKAAGYSSNPHSYAYTDNNPSSGANFYRVRINDLDGKFGFTPVRNVFMSTAGKMNIYPNPATDVLNISLGKTPTADWSVIVYNNSGQAMVNKKFNKNTTTVSLAINHYPAGNYTLRITDGNSVQSNRFVISH